jgi:hypothetical protein
MNGGAARISISMSVPPCCDAAGARRRLPAIE